MELEIPIEYLCGASETTLESFELKRLTHATNIEKEIRVMQTEAQRSRDAASLARFLRENRAALLRMLADTLPRAGAHGAQPFANDGGDSIRQSPALARVQQRGAANAD